MKLLDYIFEFAYEQNSALEKIEDKMPQLSAHLIKVLVFEDDINQKHWRAEILTFIDSIDNYCDIKSKNRRISAKTIKKSLSNTLEDRYFEKILKKLYRNYDTKLFPADKTNKQILFDSLREFYDNLFVWLEKDVINDDEILDLLKKLSARII